MLCRRARSRSLHSALQFSLRTISHCCSVVVVLFFSEKRWERVLIDEVSFRLFSCFFFFLKHWQATRKNSLRHMALRRRLNAPAQARTGHISKQSVHEWKRRATVARVWSSSALACLPLHSRVFFFFWHNAQVSASLPPNARSPTRHVQRLTIKTETRRKKSVFLN